MVIGHQRILDFLKESVRKGRLAHAYLFVGPAHLGKRTVALEFIKMLTGQEITQVVHPDILIVEPEAVEKDNVKKELEIGIDKIRQIRHQMNLFPYRAEYKIALIDQVEKMTSEASHCLLKTLEEPSGKAVLILITADLRSLFPTIVSRCQIVKFLPVPDQEIKRALVKNHVERLPFEKIIRLANGRPGLAIKYLTETTLLKEQDKIINQLERVLVADLNERYHYAEQMAKDIPLARQTLAYWLLWFRDLLLVSLGCSGLVIHPGVSQYQSAYSPRKLKKIIDAIRKTNWLLANPSINARLALEVLMLEI